MIQDPEFFRNLPAIPLMNLIEFYDWYDFNYYPSIQKENALFQFNYNILLIIIGYDYKILDQKLKGIFQK
jgi:hypothetical protein